MKYIQLFERFTKNKEVFEIIRSEYFTSHVVKISFEQREGYEIKNKTAIFGTILGTKPDVEYLIHEMGHFVLFRDYSRLLKNHYGLSYPKYEVDGREYDLAGNWTDIKNEIRASIFQVLLAEKYDIKLDINSWFSSFKYLDGFLFVPVKDAIEKDYTWYELNGEEVKFKDKEKRRFQTIKDFFEEERKKPRYTIENFDLEWFKRIKYLEENL